MDVKKAILLVALGMGTMAAVEAAEEADRIKAPVMESAQIETPIEGVNASESTADARTVLQSDRGI